MGSIVGSRPSTGRSIHTPDIYSPIGAGKHGSRPGSTRPYSPRSNLSSACGSPNKQYTPSETTSEDRGLDIFFFFYYFYISLIIFTFLW